MSAIWKALLSPLTGVQSSYGDELPILADTDEKFCGSHRLYRPDGTYMPHAETPMEAVLRTGESAPDL